MNAAPSVVSTPSNLTSKRGKVGLPQKWRISALRVGLLDGGPMVLMIRICLLGMSDERI
jgi:hypothetical protein